MEGGRVEGQQVVVLVGMRAHADAGGGRLDIGGEGMDSLAVEVDNMGHKGTHMVDVGMRPALGVDRDVGASVGEQQTKLLLEAAVVAVLRWIMLVQRLHWRFVRMWVLR